MMRNRFLYGIAATIGGSGLAATIFKKKAVEIEDEPNSAEGKRVVREAAKYVETSRKQRLSDVVQRSTDIVERFQTESGVPGLSVGVSVNGETVWSRGFGYSDLETLSPCTEQTVMRLASISKPITTVLAAHLADTGKLDLDAPVQQYATDYPQKTFAGKPVALTTRQLLSNMGGVRHYHTHKLKDTSENQAAIAAIGRKMGQNDFPEYYSNVEYKTVADAMAVFKDDPLVFEPGKTFHYTTLGWTLVSRVIEGASGDSFPNQLNDMWRTLGMHNTALDYNKPLIPNRSRQYHRVKGKVENTAEVNNSIKWAGGGVVSTAGDLLHFSHALLYSLQCGDGPHPSYLRSSTVKQLWSPVVERRDTPPYSYYGMGWGVEPAKERQGAADALWDGRGFVCHSGAAIGGSTILLIKLGDDDGAQPPRGTCVAVLANLQSCKGLSSLALELAKQFSALER